MDKKKFIVGILAVLNQLISVQLILFQQSRDLKKEIIIGEVVLMVLALIFQMIKIYQWVQWSSSNILKLISSVDISPLFFWILIMVNMISIDSTKDNAYMFYIMGFLNGQFSSLQNILDSNKIALKLKTILQTIIIFSFILYKSDEFESAKQGVLSIIIPIILVFSIAILELLQIAQNQNENIEKPQSDQNPESLMAFQESTVKIQQQLSRKSGGQRSLPLNPIWDEFIQNQYDEWIVKIELHKQDLQNAINQGISNNSLKKYMDESNLTLNSFIKSVRVINATTNLTQSLPLQQSGQILDISLIEWISQNYISDNRKRRISQIPDPLNSPGGQRQVQQQKDPLFGKDISHILAFNVDDNSLGLSWQIPEKRTVLLQCQMKNGENEQEFAVQVFYYEYDQENERQTILTMVFHNIEKQLQSQQCQDSLAEKMNTIIKFIRRQSYQTNQVSIFVVKELKRLQEHHQVKKPPHFQSLSFQDNDMFIKSEKNIKQNMQTESDNKGTPYLHIPSQSFKATVQESEFQKEQSDNNMKYSQSTFDAIQIERFRFVAEVRCRQVLIENDNMNFYEIFDQNIRGLQVEKINFDRTISELIDVLNYQQDKIEKSIQIISNQYLDDNCNTEMCTDRRRLRQLLMNYVHNALQSFTEDNPYNKIEITYRCRKDRITVEIYDNGRGITYENLSERRIQECRLGLTVNIRLLAFIGSDKNKTQQLIRDKNVGTKVVFYLEKNLDSRKKVNCDELKIESIQITDERL